MPKTYTVKDVAKILGYSTNSIYTFLKEKRIRGVRVGKGRFRIPEEELARVMHLSKTSGFSETAQTSQPQGITSPIGHIAEQSPAQTASLSQLVRPVTSFVGDAAVVREPPLLATKVKNGTQFSAPNLFDWFIGIASVVAGFALFLFNAVFGNPLFQHFSTSVYASRIILMTAGLGVIVSSIINDRTRSWRNAFYTVLMLAGAVNAALLVIGGDMDGGVIYGALAAVVLVKMLFNFGGIFSFGLYVSLLSIFIPIVFVLYPQDPHVALASSYFGIAHPMLSLIIGISGVTYLVLFWVGYFMSPPMFVVSTIVSSSVTLFGGIYLASLNFWSRSFFLLVLSFFAAILPVWRTLQEVCSKKQRTTLHALFGGVGVLFILAVGVVFLLQKNEWSNHRQQMLGKIRSAQNLIEETMTSVQGSMEVASKNPDIVTAFVKEDSNELSRLGKIIYESNPNIRRLVYLNKVGNGIGLYPYGTFDQPNFAFRDYFQAVRSTGKPFISNVFQAQTDQAGRYVIVVAVPVMSASGDFLGAMTASIDLIRVGTQLQEIATERDREFFVVLDKEGKVIFEPDTKQIGTVVSVDDPGRLALNGGTDVVMGIIKNGQPGMISYAQNRTLGWSISLRAPIANVYHLTHEAILWTFSVISFILMACIIFLLYFKSEWCDIPEVGT